MRKLSGKIALSFVLLAFFPNCKPRQFNQSDENGSATQSRSEDISEHYKPVGAWTGRLILPEQNKRRNGGVFFEVHNAPNPEVVGQTLWLEFDTGNEGTREYLKRTTDSVHITTNPRTPNGIKSYPMRINGWGKVSPLESLAGARPEDNMEVMLRDADYDGGKTIKTKREPIQITGRAKALVRFVGAVRGKKEIYRVKHWGSKNFNGPEEEIYVPDSPNLQTLKTPYGSVEGIEDNHLNKAGWYIFGERLNSGAQAGMFRVRALEPRELMLIESDQHIGKIETAKKFIDNELWADARRNVYTSKKIMLLPMDLRAPDRNGRVYSPVKFDLGSKYLVMHVFGNIGGPKGEGPTFKSPLPVATGHFAFGIARVVIDEFTREKKFHIEFKQVYAHNLDFVVAGSSLWQNYNGSLERGWIYSRATADAIIGFEPLNQLYSIKNKSFDPLRALEFDLEEIMARYRIGNGDGVSAVSAAASCAQDSAQALFRSLTDLSDHYNEIVEAGRRYGAGNEEEFRRIGTLGNDLMGYMFPILGLKRSDWNANVKEISYGKYKEGNVIEALKSFHAMFPRHSFDGIAKTFLDNGASLFIQRSLQMGGRVKGYLPCPPDSLLIRNDENCR